MNAGPLSSRPEDPRPAVPARAPAEEVTPVEGATSAQGASPAGDDPRHAAPVPARPTPEPTRTLAPEARALWTLTAFGQALALGLVAGVVGARLVPEDLRVPVVALAAVAAALHVVVLPRLRWRRWRYEVREQEIDLRRGAFTVRRTLVPMSRVQHVDTRRTVVSEMFGLAAVVFHTAAGANEIPALKEADAAEIRDRIADLAAGAEDPV